MQGAQHGDVIKPPINDDIFLGRWVVNNKRNDDTDDEFLDVFMRNLLDFL